MNMLDNQSNTQGMRKSLAPCTERGKKLKQKQGITEGNSNNLAAFFFSHSDLGVGSKISASTAAK